MGKPPDTSRFPREPLGKENDYESQTKDYNTVHYCLITGRHDPTNSNKNENTMRI